MEWLCTNHRSVNFAIIRLSCLSHLCVCSGQLCQDSFVLSNIVDDVFVSCERCKATVDEPTVTHSCFHSLLFGYHLSTIHESAAHSDPFSKWFHENKDKPLNVVHLKQRGLVHVFLVASDDLSHSARKAHQMALVVVDMKYHQIQLRCRGAICNRVAVSSIDSACEHIRQLASHQAYKAIVASCDVTPIPGKHRTSHSTPIKTQFI